MMVPHPSTIIEPNKSYVSFLQSKKCTLEAKKSGHLDSLKNLRLNEETSCEDLIIDIGSVFWVEKSYQEALAFMERQIDYTSDAIEKISAEISWHSGDLCTFKDDQKLVSPESSSGDEQSLQIVEIQELLDENGEVIEVKLNEEPFSLQSDVLSEGHGVLSENKSVPLSGTSGAPTENSEFKSPANSKEINDDQIGELFQDMEIIDETNESDGGASKSKTEADGMSVQKSIQTVVEPKQIYELELIAGEFHSDDDDFEKEEDFDYDFEFEESDDESFELQSPSNFMATIDTSMLPGGSDISDRLRNEIIALRRQRQEKSVSEKSNAPKKVHFNNTLQIKEIENVSADLLNIEHKKQKMSRFKEIKTSNIQPSVVANSTEIPTNVHDAIHSQETRPKGYGSESSGVVSDIFERNDENVAEQRETTSRDSNRVSKFRKRIEEEGHTSPGMILQTEEFNKLEHRSPEKELSGLNPVMKMKPQVLASDNQLSGIDLSDLSNFNKAEGENLEAHMERLVKAYNEGNFDEDISGPIVNKLDDFGVLNKMIESMSKKETKAMSSEKPGISYDPDATNEVGNFSSDSSDEEIMTDLIVEREMDENAAADEVEDFRDADSIEQDVIDREITEQYYRLKEKLLVQRSTNANDREYQETGNVSKFKARKFQSF